MFYDVYKKISKFDKPHLIKQPYILHTAVFLPSLLGEDCVEMLAEEGGVGDDGAQFFELLGVGGVGYP